MIATTNASGTVVSQAIYDPWGKRTAVYLTSVLANFTYSEPTDRGYTGHKHIKDLDIIHMGGRIYDPTLGRFLQADPNIQAPLDSQSYNRYAYVRNNPMSMTDPSGYFFKKLHKALMDISGLTFIHKQIAKVNGLGAAIQVGLNFIPFFGQLASAHFAFDASFVATGSLGVAIKTGAISYVSGMVFKSIGEYFNHLSSININSVAWEGGQLGGFLDFGGNLLTKGQVIGQVSSHAIAGGIISSLGGGNFGHGFISAGVTKGLGGVYLPGGNNLNSYGDVIKNTIVSSVIGGTTSRLIGGKFANGAQTAAMQYLFNQAVQWWHRVNYSTPSRGDRPRQTADGLLAQQAGAKSVSDYNITTNAELKLAATSVGVGAALVGSAPISIFMGAAAGYYGYQDSRSFNEFGGSSFDMIIFGLSYSPIAPFSNGIGIFGTLYQFGESAQWVNGACYSPYKC